MQQPGGQEDRSISSSSCPPALQLLVFPDSASTLPQGTGMSGSFLSGEKGKGGAPGRPNPRVPPKRSTSLMSQGFKLLPTDQGAFDLYGGLEGSGGGSPHNENTNFPAAASLGQPKVSPRMLPPRNTRRLSGGNNRLAQGKSLKTIDKANRAGNNKLPSAKPDIASLYDRMLMGYLDHLPERSSSTIRIFLSSTFSDFKTERNYLVKKAYPNLRQFCEEQGFKFQVLDLRWGITDNSVNDHMVELICMAEVDQCRRVSPGPNFVSMLGNRYGYRPLLRSILATEFDNLIAIAQQANLANVDLLKKWYIMDYNALPTAYVLQEIQNLIPNYGDQTEGKEDLAKEADKTWCETKTKLQDTLRRAAMMAHGRNEIDDARLHAYHMSVTEQEVIRGLLGTQFAEASCLSIMRDVENIGLLDKNASRYVDMVRAGDSMEVDIGAEALMTSLKTSIANKLPPESIKCYTVNWKNQMGIDQGDSEHGKYLKKMSRDFVDSLKVLITEQINREHEQRRKAVSHVVTIHRPTTGSRPLQPLSKSKKVKGKSKGTDSMNGATTGGLKNVSDSDFLRGFMTLNTLVQDHKAIEKGNSLATLEAQIKLDLYSEIMHHLTFVRDKCDAFFGREDELAFIRKYVTSFEESTPLVVTSPAGGGKSSFMAKIAKMTKEWLGEQTVTIVRFLGTSPKSSTLLAVLSHLCAHLSLAYGEIIQHYAMNGINTAQMCFRDLLILVSSHGNRRPLVIILDSTDQISVYDSPHLLHWLPKFLPGNVKIIVSMTPDVNNSLEHARNHLQSDDTFLSLHLQPLPAEAATRFIEEYPKTQGRQLTEQQLRKLVQEAETLPSPLLLKLWVDEACLWKSYTPDSKLFLAETVAAAVDNIFDNLEKKYGTDLVSSALGYVTICWNGISEVELEDVLSCDDMVLNEVFKYHDPPLEGTIRIPPLLWARIRNDLREYLVENQTMERQILSWYYRQFGQVVIKKYTTGSSGCRLHANLAEIFMTEQNLCKTINLIQRKKIIQDADRLVHPQKLEPTNVRKLICVPYHLKMSGDIERLKTEVVCNIAFLECLLQGILNKDNRTHEKAIIWQLLDDIDEETRHVIQALRKAQPLIKMDMSLLPIQLLDMLLPYKDQHPAIASLCEHAETRVKNNTCAKVKPVIGCVGDGASPVNWYHEGPTRIIDQSPDGTTLLLGYSGRSRTVPMCTIFDVRSCQVTHTLKKWDKLASDILFNGQLSQNNRRAYLLCKKNYVIYNMLEKCAGGKALVATNNINGAGSLNETLVVSAKDNMLVLAGPNRLAMFEDCGKCFDEPDFKVKRAMNFSGAKATTNIIFTSDESGSISSHTVPGQKRVIGALACWTFYSENPCHKVPLPEPVPPGCLRALPAMAEPECVLVSCADGKVYIVSMRLCTILKEIKNSVGLRGYNLLMTVHPNYKWVALGCKDKQTVALLDLSEDIMVGHVEVHNAVQALLMGPDEGHLTVLRRDGVVKLYSVEGLVEKASYKAHESDTTSLFFPDPGHVLTCGYDKMLNQLELQRLLTRTEDCSAMAGEESKQRLEYAAMDLFLMIDDDTILTGDSQHPPTVWDLKTGCKKKQLEGSQGGSVNVAVALQGGRVINMDRATKSATQWDWPTGNAVKFPPYIKDIIKMCISPIDHIVVFICEHTPGTLVLIFDLKENKETLRVILHEKLTDSTTIFITKNGRYISFLREFEEEDEDGEKRPVIGALTIDTTKNSEQEPSWLERDIKTIVPLDSELFLLGERSGVVVWQPPRVIGVSDMGKQHGGWLQFKQPASKDKKDAEEVSVSVIAVSMDDRYIAVVGDDGSLTLWQNILKQDGGGGPQKSMGTKLKRHTHMVLCATFSPDGCHLASGSADKTLILWETSSGSVISQIHTHARVMDIKFTTDGNKILFTRNTSQVQRISVWDCASNTE